MKALFSRDIYLILDAEMLRGRDLPSTVKSLLDAGVRWLQYRDKASSDARIARSLETLIPLCHGAGAKLIINDRAGLVPLTGADGVHLGRDDMPLIEARNLLGENAIIGCSARGVGEALRAEGEGADYLGVGAVYASETKPDAHVIGLEGVRAVCRAVKIPVVAIGGIGMKDVMAIVEAGASAVAVCAAVLKAPDIGRAAGLLLKQMKRW